MGLATATEEEEGWFILKLIAYSGMWQTSLGGYTDMEEKRGLFLRGGSRHWYALSLAQQIC